MTRSMVSVGVAVYLLAHAGLTVVAQQQDPTRAPIRFPVPVKIALPEDPETNLAEETAEDMAVMKRILDEALEEVYELKRMVTLSGDGTGGVMLRYDADSGTVAAVDRNSIDDALSAYLEGYGVVYQLTAPPPGEEPKKVQADTAAAAERPTRWEATRRRVLGTAGDLAKTGSEGVDVQARASILVADSIQFAPAGAFPTRSRVTEKLLEVLAENGHNFRHLGPNERLTVALTFRKNKASSGSRPKTFRGVMAYGGTGSGWYGGSASSIEGDEDHGGMMEMDMGVMSRKAAELGGMMGAAVGAAMGGGEGFEIYEIMAQDGSSGMQSGYRGYQPDPDLTAGDLHLRQGNYKKAVEAYEKNVRKRVKKDPYKHQPTGSLVAVYQKLAQAQVGAGEYAKAQQLIEAINKARAKPASPEKSEPRFPAQLVISATKGDLDQVAAGKMTFEEFKKKATAQYFDPRSVEAESDDAAKRATAHPR